MNAMERNAMAVAILRDRYPTVYASILRTVDLAESQNAMEEARYELRDLGHPHPVTSPRYVAEYLETRVFGSEQKIGAAIKVLRDEQYLHGGIIRRSELALSDSTDPDTCDRLNKVLGRSVDIQRGLIAIRKAGANEWNQ